MIDGKILKFGYGDIGVSNVWRNMRFIPFKPPVEIGTDTRPLFADGSIEAVGEPIMITFETFQDFNELQDKLKNVYTQRVFEFKGYTFDFSNYNEKSVEVCNDALRRAYMNFLQCAAC